MAVNVVAKRLEFLFGRSVRMYPPMDLLAEDAMAGIVEPSFTIAR